MSDLEARGGDPLRALLETTYLPNYTHPEERLSGEHMNDAAQQAARLHRASSPNLHHYAPYIRNYTGSLSAFLNGQLLKHEGDPSKFEDTLMAGHKELQSLDGGLQQAMKHGAAPLPERTHLFSGVGREFGKKLAAMKPGDPVHSHAYISWSNDGLIASNRASTAGEPNPTMARHFIHLDAPEGFTGGIFVAGHSSFAHEKEFISNRGQRFRYVGTTVGSEVGGTGTHFVMHHVEPMT